MNTRTMPTRWVAGLAAVCLAATGLVAGGGRADAVSSPLTTQYCSGQFDCILDIAPSSETGRVEGQAINVTVRAQPNMTVSLRAYALTWDGADRPDEAVPIGAAVSKKTDSRGLATLNVPTNALKAPLTGAGAAFTVQASDFSSENWRSNSVMATTLGAVPRFDLHSSRALLWGQRNLPAGSDHDFDTEVRYGIPGQTMQMQALRGGRWHNVGSARSGNGVVAADGRAVVEWSVPYAWGPGVFTTRLYNATKGMVLFSRDTLIHEGPSGVWGDQDGNRTADILGVDPSGRLRVYLTLAGPRVSDPFFVGSGWSSTTWIGTLPDLDGNRRSELLARRADGSLWLYRGVDVGGYSSPTKVGSGWNSMSLMTITADIDGDRQPELFARTADGTLRRYTVGLGGASYRNVIGKGWGSVKSLVNVGDASGDGRSDLLGIKANGDLVRYTLNAAGYASATHQIGRGWTTMNFGYSPGDVTGDGVRDLVGRRNDGVLVAYRHLGQGRFTAALAFGGDGWNGARLLA